jgi:transposase-like protein
MPRQSSHDHLKPEALGLFAEGKSPAEVCKTYPGIPRGTVYRWHESWQQENTDKIRTNTDNPVDTGSRISELRPKLTVIPAADDGIGWALRVCKSIIQENISRDPRVAVSALNAYFKGLEMTQTQTQEKQLEYDDAVEDLLQFFEARGIPMENLW